MLERLLRDLAAGALIGVLCVVLAVSLASLVFAGGLEAYRAQGIGLALLSTLVVGIAVTLTGALPGATVSVQDTPAAILAVMAAGLVATLPSGADPRVAFASTVALVALTSFATGIAFLVVGSFGLGKLVRYLPYPVLGGFLAGTGWLLLSGGIGVMAGVSLRFDTIGELFTPASLVRWVPGLALAVVMVIALRRWRHPLVFPGLLVAAVALFWAALVASGDGSAAWRAAGLLLGPFPDGAALGAVRPSDLVHVAWDAVARQAVGGATVVTLSLLALLLNATALEHALGRSVDLDRELRAAGIGNLLSGSVGGMPGYHVLSFSLLNRRIGSGTRRSFVLALAVVAAVVLAGPSLLEVVPTLVVGGVLAYLGLALLIEWLHGAFFTLEPSEYGIVVVILVAIVALGFLPGVIVGLVLAIALFVMSYARIDPVERAFDGAERSSRVRRNAEDARSLVDLGRSLLGLRLHGFLFFGSVHAVVGRVEDRLSAQPPLTHLVLDFAQVSGVDATAAAALAGLARTASEAEVTFLLSGLGAAPARQIENALRRTAPEARAAMTETLDEALERCERELLARTGTAPEPFAALRAAYAAATGAVLELDRLLAHFTRVDVAAGERVIRQGDESDALYLMERGRLSAWFEPDGGPPMRLETMEGGTIVGESGLYTGASRSASVDADVPSTLYRLSRGMLGE
jgi:sulfate permease, SulP family